jgi:formate dehydrogenase iron-sulfur subunit
MGTLIDTLINEQRRLTAVEKFSRAHSGHDGPAERTTYRDLIPLTAPRPGEQYAFEVDLDRCSGCKACVTACHSLNGLDEDESWREVGFLVGEEVVPLARAGEKGRGDAGEPSARASSRPYSPAPGNKVIPLQQTVTTACHHCVDPGCLNGCPVLAYDKDPVTGIVRHLDDQCIGCSYCILKCPYDVPKYSESRGIVRKCDMCQGRLAEGEAPACVQACPNTAIRITLVDPEAVRRDHRGAKGPMPRGTIPSAVDPWLADSPRPGVTLPTTRYLSSRPGVALRSADHARPKPQHAHWPLVLMLVLTQAGIGGSVVVASMSTGGTAPMNATWLVTASFALLGAGLFASVFHLGQPTKAWRVWMGWRTSWLSREAVALNAFAGAASGALALIWAGDEALVSRLPAGFAGPLALAGGMPAFLWVAPVVVLGSIALFAQAMVYADTHREFWRIGVTAPRFLGTAVVLGSALALAITPSEPLAVVLIGANLCKLALDVSVLKHGDSDSATWTQLRRTASLQRGALRPVLAVRLLAGTVGGVFVPFAMVTGAVAPAWGIAVFATCVLGEIAERLLFFTSVSPDKMPGMP